MIGSCWYRNTQKFGRSLGRLAKETAFCSSICWQNVHLVRFDITRDSSWGMCGFFTCYSIYLINAFDRLSWEVWCFFSLLSRRPVSSITMSGLAPGQSLPFFNKTPKVSSGSNNRDQSGETFWGRHISKIETRLPKQSYEERRLYVAGITGSKRYSTILFPIIHRPVFYACISIYVPSEVVWSWQSNLAIFLSTLLCCINVITLVWEERVTSQEVAYISFNS